MLFVCFLVGLNKRSMWLCFEYCRVCGRSKGFGGGRGGGVDGGIFVL